MTRTKGGLSIFGAVCLACGGSTPPPAQAVHSEPTAQAVPVSDTNPGYSRPESSPAFAQSGDERLPPATLGASPVVVADEPETAGTEVTPPPSGPALRDAQTAAVLLRAHTTEVELAGLARTRTRDTRVRELAQEMIEAHTAGKVALERCLTNSSIVPEPSDMSRRVSEDGGHEARVLRRLRGAGFDRAYVDSQIQMHEELLGALDDQMIPGAMDTALRELLAETRRAVAHHLERSRAVRADLPDTGTRLTRGERRHAREKN